MKRIIMLCLAAFAFSEETEPPCALGYCMGQTMEGEPDNVSHSGLLQTRLEDDPTFDPIG